MREASPLNTLARCVNRLSQAIALLGTFRPGVSRGRNINCYDLLEFIFRFSLASIKPDSSEDKPKTVLNTSPDCEHRSQVTFWIDRTSVCARSDSSVASVVVRYALNPSQSSRGYTWQNCFTADFANSRRKRVQKYYLSLVRAHLFTARTSLVTLSHQKLTDTELACRVKTIRATRKGAATNGLNCKEFTLSHRARLSFQARISSAGSLSSASRDS